MDETGNNVRRNARNNSDFVYAQWHLCAGPVIQGKRTARGTKNLILGDEFSWRRRRGTAEHLNVSHPLPLCLFFVNEQQMQLLASLATGDPTSFSSKNIKLSLSIALGFNYSRVQSRWQFLFARWTSPAKNYIRSRGRYIRGWTWKFSSCSRVSTCFSLSVSVSGKTATT